MKQGTLNSRIVMLVVLAAVLISIGVSAFSSLRDLYPTVLAYTYTSDDSVEATGFLVRQESVLAGQGGTVEILPEEGEKVSLGSRSRGTRGCPAGRRSQRWEHHQRSPVLPALSPLPGLL